MANAQHIDDQSANESTREASGHVLADTSVAESTTSAESRSVRSGSEQEKPMSISTPAKASLEQSTPRKPAGLPAGATLADRIAALQKSSSVRSKGGRSERAERSVSSVGSSVTSGAGSNGGGSGFSASGEATRSVSSGPRIGTGAGGANGASGVRDRIAKFQADEKPLIPKSSFGSPAPMHGDRNTNALRPYPGAVAGGGGSGQWGEGVLRPQMTGGTWVGGGEGRGWHMGDMSSGSGVRPQLTGGAWLGVGGPGTDSSPSAGRIKGTYSPNGSLSRSPMKQRDAFLDLDEESNSTTSSTTSPPHKIRAPLRRDASFSDAQLAAASKGLQRTSRASSTDGGRAESVGGMTTSSGTSMANLPDVPTQDVVAKQSESSQSALGLKMTDLPRAPSNMPTIRSPSAANINDVEISVANVTPERLEKLRRTASGSYADSFATSPTSDESAGHQRSALLSELQARRGNSIAGRSIRSAASADEATTDIGNLIISSNDTDDDYSAVGDSPAVGGTTDLPQRAQVQRTKSDQVDAADPRAHQPVGPEVLVPQDEVAVKADTAGGPTTIGSALPSAAPVPRPTHERSESGIIDPMADVTASPSWTNVTPSATSSNVGAGAPAGHRSNGSDATILATDDAQTARVLTSGMSKSNSEGLNEQQIVSATASAKAKEAISAARSKSQRIKRPPPGRMMTAAEMDASDDEYEPGWASVTTVISSSRQK